MNRRELLLGAATVLGGGASLYPYRDEIPKIPNVSEEMEDSDSVEESSDEGVIDIKKCNYDVYQEAPEFRPNDHDADVVVELENISDDPLDVKLQLTPVHKNGEELKTHSGVQEIRPLESKVYEKYWEDNSTQYVTHLKIEVLTSDLAWFNGWETALETTYDI